MHKIGRRDRTCVRCARSCAMHMQTDIYMYMCIYIYIYIYKYHRISNKPQFLALFRSLSLGRLAMRVTHMCIHTHIYIYIRMNDWTSIFLHMLCFLWAQMRQRLITFLNKQNDERRIRCREGLKEHVKSSTDKACQHAREQKRELIEAVVKLTDRIHVLHSWLSEALPLV